jgi:sulfite reductase (NADPH) flavoprotein alpha-component
MSDTWSLASDSRIMAAACVAILYLTCCAWTVLRHRRRATVPSAAPVSTGATQVVYASQTGFAQQLAEQTLASLQAAGETAALHSLRVIDLDALVQSERMLFVVSTTGEGDAPDAAAGFVHSVLAQHATLKKLRYAILALGDREYDNFCAFGHRLDAWLRHQGAQPLFDVVEVNNGDAAALRHWQHQLGVLTGAPDLPDWDTPRYERWRLTQRQLLNEGSAGGPCFHLALQPVAAAEAIKSVSWNAGDIAEVDPHNSTWDTDGAALPHREYSIASIPEDGVLELLVRQMRRPDGTIGLGSGWLTNDVPLQGEVALRIRGNSNFHPPTDAQPLLLIGNGTGLAGLRAILKARIAAGQRRNWLLFGERNAACDYFHRAEIEQWQRDGFIEHLDAVFSRDQPQRRYVQHLLLERAALVREWLNTGAVYVCGSLEGMAPGVDAALQTILGAAAFEDLAATGRYRRDVY